MYLLSQTLIYLALALVVGGAIGFAWRSCLSDESVGLVQNEMAVATPQNDAADPGLHNDRAHQPTPPVIETPPTQYLADLSSRELEAVLLNAAPGQSPKARFGADDLTAIMGITPQIDVWLGLQGITRFSHIADLSAAELYWLVENLPHKGASVYDHQWVAQAAKLARAKS
jgi:predicted flap endonuclease-1-like 5' DNA nuclease